MAFTPAALRFFRALAKNNNKEWFEAHRAEYEREVREPMRDLIGEMDARFLKFAPEIGGDPKRSMFRINRDIRFSSDKSPYKTNAACWFHHRRASSRVGSDVTVAVSGDVTFSVANTWAWWAASSSWAYANPINAPACAQRNRRSS
jgi:uncharacterized protein (TIGR02453 family)